MTEDVPDVSEPRCEACGHRHETLARVSNLSAGNPEYTRWYCHENDHSCYKERGWHWGTNRETLLSEGE